MKDAMISIGARSWRFPGAQIDTDSWELEWHSDGKVYLHDCVGNLVEGLEMFLPSPEERRHREVLLARVMLVAIDIVLAGDPLGLETVRDLLWELRHCYPELVDEFVNL